MLDEMEEQWREFLVERLSEKKSAKQAHILLCKEINKKYIEV